MDRTEKFPPEEPITAIIKRRGSVRTYDGRQLPEEIKAELRRICTAADGPFAERVRIEFIEKITLGPAVKLGTYGVIQGAPSFLAAAVQKGDRPLEQLGFVFEKVILEATALGLGTCWLGGSFSRGDFARAMALAENEFIPIVSPVGYKKERRRLVDSLIRATAGSSRRKPWSELFFHQDFDRSLTEAEAGEYAEALEMVRLAPSASNKQPWRIVKDRAGLHFYEKHAAGYASMGFDMQRIDLGIAMCHLQLAAAERGLAGRWVSQAPGIGEIPAHTEYIISWMT
ncbi:putative nitroreductase [Hydrogenispora ethanolica]|uniref:Putative nitroreductase n=1 Tax=Hydrogenispora ethanolica TaxID=1082276 RepID=A0A4R1R827_HYDET|nr:nitroreductase family protein [Hydrogenispora ethanolica]TCL61793.1 putative nitroreductase [Hydrogenispora ethanolica]